MKASSKPIDELTLRQKFMSSPSIMAQEGQDYARELLEGASVPFFIPEMDKADGGLSLPMRKGEVIIFFARPGGGKTTWGLGLANHIGGNLPVNRRPVFVTRETIVEDTSIFLMAHMANKHMGKNYTTEDFALGRVPEKEIIQASNLLAHLNMYVVGRKWSNFGRVFDDLNLEVVWQLLNDLRAEGTDPAFIVLDYLQKFQPIDSHWNDDQGRKILKVVQEVEYFSLTAGIPVILLAQAKREVDDRKPPIGSMSDLQWTSEGEKVGSRMYYLWRPHAHPQYAEMEFIEVGKDMYLNFPYLFIITKLKERLTDMYGRRALHFHPGKLEIKSIESRSTNFNDLVNYSEEEAREIASQSRIAL